MQRAVCALTQRGHERQLLTDVGYDALGGVGRRRSTDVGDQIKERCVLFVPDGADDRRTTGRNRPAERLVRKRQEILYRAAAACDDDDVDLGVLVEPSQ